jgi:hypothetical protein
MLAIVKLASENRADEQVLGELKPNLWILLAKKRKFITAGVTQKNGVHLAISRSRDAIVSETRIYFQKSHQAKTLFSAS